MTVWREPMIRLLVAADASDKKRNEIRNLHTKERNGFKHLAHHSKQKIYCNKPSTNTRKIVKWFWLRTIIWLKY